jgi:hypothetical protein
MSTAHEFLLKHRVKIDVTKYKETEHDPGLKVEITGYVTSIEEIGGKEKIYIVKDDGDVSWVIPNHSNIHHFHVQILDWNPNNPEAKNKEQENRFELMDLE